MQTPTPGGPVPHVGGPLTGAPPAPPVLIAGQPAATVGCQTMCATPAGPVPNVYTMGSTSVLIGGKPALRVGDMGTQAAHPGSMIAPPGAPTVIIGG